MIINKILTFVLLSAALLFAQVEQMQEYQTERIRYYQDFLNFADSNQTRVDVFVQVPFRGIQFVKTSGGLRGGYSVTVSVYDEDKERLIIEKMWNEKIKVKSFSEASDRDNFNISHRSFNLKPGKYFIKTILMDKDSKQEFPSENVFEVKDFSVRPSISDIMLISEKTKVNGKSKIIPNISRNVSGKRNGINIYFEVYTDDESNNTLEYVISNKDEEVVFSSFQKRKFNAGTNKIFYVVEDSSLSLGNYLLSIFVKDEKGNLIASTHKRFYSRLRGMPVTIESIDKAISQMKYIATPEELGFIEDGKSEDERTKRFIEFWKKKDPSPGNEENEVFEEYYRRVAYANKSFSSYSEGWASDRGMVFIILGAPNYVERHPFELDSKPYEVWQYYELNKNFIFVDETGFGDYRLVTPLYGDYFRYRY